ncbi:MAG: winged helix-turn-helix domain-containing protein [Motilibacteraceae bacterium]
MTSPTGGLDEVVHQRHRLGILTVASEADEVEFTYLRDTLGLTAGNLNRHLAVLEDAGLITVTKGYQGRRPRTWVSITAPGRKALAVEMAVLRELVHRHERGRGVEAVEQ